MGKLAVSIFERGLMDGDLLIRFRFSLGEQLKYSDGSDSHLFPSGFSPGEVGPCFISELSY